MKALNYKNTDREPLTVTEVRTRLKSEGYNIKTKSLYIGIVGDIVDSDGEYVVGSSGNVFSKEHIKKHQKIFDFYNYIKDIGVTRNNEKVIL